MVGEELARNAIISVILASLGIMVYIAFRFEYLFGIAAIVGLIHDALFVLMIFSLFQIEINIKRHKRCPLKEELVLMLELTYNESF